MNFDVLKVQNLRVFYHTQYGPVKAVEDVSFSLIAGERFGLVGESGSGKSTVAMSILRLIKPPGRIEGGEIWLNEVNPVEFQNDGQREVRTNGINAKNPGLINLLSLTDEEMRQVRLAKIALISQGSMNSLNPVARVKNQLLDGMRDHVIYLSKKEKSELVQQLLEQVGLRPDVANKYPHELSGGMKQRVCIAIAISLHPRIIIADEPTSALDVVVQGRVIETLHRLQKDLNSTMLLVGHDMGLMAQSVERLAVMYAGRLMEVSPVNDLFANPRHPYAQLLIGTLPSFKHKGEFRGIPGLPPSQSNSLRGCPFHPRCPFAIEQCSIEEPPLREIQPGRQAACHLL